MDSCDTSTLVVDLREFGGYTLPHDFEIFFRDDTFIVISESEGILIYFYLYVTDCNKISVTMIPVEVSLTSMNVSNSTCDSQILHSSNN